MKKTVLRKYAQLIAQMGLNVQKGQDVWVRAGLDQPEFVDMVVQECYKLGARDVRVEWSYPPITKTTVKYQKLKTLGGYDSWQEEKLKYQAKVIPCRLFIESDDPDALKGVNTKKMTQGIQMRYPIVKKYGDTWENKDQWCIVAVPGEKWAKKIFPTLSKHQAVEKLWQAILDCARVDDDPIQAWKDHNQELHERCAYLNKLGIKELHYKGTNGTDLTVGMIDRGRFAAGQETSLQKITFNPNMPSEECFTSPMRGKAEGIVYATKPLSYQGQLIDKFWIRFKEGKAVEWDAELGLDVLTKMITMDEGAAYLGECALVPVDSPISESGLLFYNTLFDENAACHLALGRGFQDCIEGFEELSLEECRKLGINDSMNHVDFMIGFEGLDITATCKDGHEVPIFKNGTWAFKLN